MTGPDLSLVRYVMDTYIAARSRPHSDAELVRRNRELAERVRRLEAEVIRLRNAGEFGHVAD